MPGPGGERRPSLGYEFAREAEARAHASELDRRFSPEEIVGLRVYRVRWNGNYIVEATFSEEIPQGRMMDARAICSDVRFRIDKLFREAGITIAFPQRDVHMDTLKPLDIRLVKGVETTKCL